MLLTDADQLREALAIAMRERDEARNAARELRAAIKDLLACLDAQGDSHGCRRFDLAPAMAHAEWLAAITDAQIATEAREYAQACEWALEAEQEYTARLKADLALECREVAERQREACAERMRLTVDSNAEHLCRTTPLVTEGEP